MEFVGLAKLGFVTSPVGIISPCGQHSLHVPGKLQRKGSNYTIVSEAFAFYPRQHIGIPILKRSRNIFPQSIYYIRPVNVDNDI